MRDRLPETVVRALALGVAAAASAIACGGATTGPGAGGGSGTVSGTVAGTTFVVASEVAAVAPESTTCSGGFGGDGGGGQTCTSSGQAVIVVLTNRADATCAAVQAEATSSRGITFANFDELELIVGTSTGTVAPGTYQVAPQTGAPSGAAAIFGTTDSTCGVKLDVQGQSGTITITSLDATGVSGSYDVSFGTQGSFSGSFDVALCALPDGGVSTGVDAGPPVCQ